MLDREIIIRRLAIIKYLYNVGVQQSRQVETVAGFSILAFHDCAEMFLLLVSENKGDNSDRWSFIEFWNQYPELTLKESMRNLKDRRVSIKHKGQFPSKSDVEICRITMADFLEQNTIIQFGLEFKDVSVSNLVSYTTVKKYLDIAESCFNKGNMYDCIINCKIAFIEMLSTYEYTKRKNNWINSLLNVGDEIGNDYQKLVGYDEKSGARWFKQVTETSNKIREILKITALGIDYRKYTYFEAVTPEVRVWWKEGGREYDALPQTYFEEHHNLKSEDCRFCMDFVIDSALRLQEFDYDINNIIK